MSSNAFSAHAAAYQARGLTPIDWSGVLAEQLPILIQRALDEDAGDKGDVTTLATIPADLEYSGTMLAKAPGVVAGLLVARQSFWQVDPTVEFSPLVEDGAAVSP